MQTTPNKALYLTAIALRCTAATELQALGKESKLVDLSELLKQRRVGRLATTIGRWMCFVPA